MKNNFVLEISSGRDARSLVDNINDSLSKIFEWNTQIAKVVNRRIEDLRGQLFGVDETIRLTSYGGSDFVDTEDDQIQAGKIEYQIRTLEVILTSINNNLEMAIENRENIQELLDNLDDS